MKALLLSLLVAFVGLAPDRLLALEKPDCPDNSCFDTQIINEQKQDGCTTYTLEVSQDGSCRYALSHFSIEVPCGRITDVQNSEGWAMEVGTTDPTTGITGIKIDDIKNFGESSRPQRFTVTYTLCDANCESLAPEKVAYKAATCVHYQELTPVYAPMAASVVSTNLSCAASADGAINLSVSGGALPYSFSWSNGATTEDLQDLSAGTYRLTVTDAKGETLQKEIHITAPAALQLNAEVTAASCVAEGSVSVSTSGGVAPYTYSWSNGAGTSSIQAAAGTYELLVADAKGCTVKESFTIEENADLQLSISGGSSCEDTILAAQITGGTAPYTYAWNSGESTSTLEVEQSGTYSLTVTDANGCSASASKEVVSGDAPVVSFSKIDPACGNGADGSIDLTVEGVSGEFTIKWSNGATTEDLQNLEAGSYSVTVKAANGCSTTATVVLSAPQSIFVRNTGIVQPDCNGGQGSISVEAYFGVEPYTFEWNNGETGSTISGLDPGAYQLTVTDANGCTASRSFTITSPNTPQVTITGGNCSNTLSASVSGGVAPYTYEWANGETSSTIEITEGGVYEVVVTDANGCSTIQSIEASDPSQAISLTYDVQQLSCYGANDGSIDLTAEGGSGDFTYTWSNGATTEDLENLPAGTYTVSVSNGSGCTSSATITITSPNAIFIRPVAIKNVSCLGEGGSIEVDAAFGTAPYTYEWNNGATGSYIENVEVGYHTVTVTDAAGCSSQRGFYVSQDNAPQVQISANGCGASQELAAIVSGGKYPYSYNWSNGETTGSISAEAGSYSLTVTDANGCSAAATIELESAESPISLAVSINQVSCAGGSNGSASLKVDGGVAPYTYDWSNGSSGSEVYGLKAGVYSVNVTDAGGCSEMLAFTISEPQAISITAVAENSTGCGEPTGSIEVQVQGGSAPYLYNWNTGAETASISNLTPGVYTLTVEDAKGCVAIRSFKVEQAGGGSSPLASLPACADTVICRGTSAHLPVTFTGEGPFTLVYSDGQQEYSVTTSSNSYMLEVQPQSLTTYQLVSVQNSCGTGVVSGQASIQVSDCTKGQICEDGCFSTQVLKRESSGSCETITLQVTTDGNCKNALSHFTVAAGCGTISHASNSAGWPMELNSIDPTTGLYGIKVDEIKNFGEGKSPQSFTLTYTLCSTNSKCLESAVSCGPLVAYKAGTCIFYDKATEGGQFIASQESGPALRVLGEMALLPNFELYPNPLERGQVLNIRINELTAKGKATLLIRSLTGMQIYQGSFTVGPADNQLQLSLPYMPSGTFVVSLEVEGHIITKQLYVL